MIEKRIEAQGDPKERVKLLTKLGYGLDQLALKTAKRFRFIPAQDVEGRPVSARIVWQFRFERPDY